MTTTEWRKLSDTVGAGDGRWILLAMRTKGRPPFVGFGTYRAERFIALYPRQAAQIEAWAPLPAAPTEPVPWLSPDALPTWRKPKATP